MPDGSVRTWTAGASRAASAAPAGSASTTRSGRVLRQHVIGTVDRFAERQHGGPVGAEGPGEASLGEAAGDHGDVAS